METLILNRKEQGNNINTTELTPHLQLKERVDTFSTLADTKDVDQQLQLFTEDAVVASYVNGEAVASFEEREAIGQAFLTTLTSSTRFTISMVNKL
ncbi:nuclear transport factor 2 family protein [Streptococcus troglodytae]|uniref:nuclear transport factor 2 family protein n=1 Tax=Streptococcus troglodytae TaxID=1111760 RepID=UPI001CB775B1|nr:nuclear transport factor 2 family protein [Streptococcus troglodytae]